jgi:hypothetical protein
LRDTHAVPLALPPPPEAWRTPYRRMAASLTVPADLDEGYRLAAAFLTPLLDDSAADSDVWSHESSIWSGEAESSTR